MLGGEEICHCLHDQHIQLWHRHIHIQYINYWSGAWQAPMYSNRVSYRGNAIQRLEATGSHCNDILHHGCTCNIESTVCYDHGSICSFSFALHHCPTQSGCGVECQGGGHISQQSIHYSSGVGSVFVRVVTKLKSAHCTVATSNWYDDSQDTSLPQ